MVPDAVVVLDGGDPLDPAAVADVPAGTPVVAADGGLVVARALGLAVTELVGDLDSAPPALVAEAEAAGVVVHRHPADKDATDGQLAVARAVELLAGRGGDAAGRPHLLVVGPGGGRLDQLLADVALLAAHATLPVEVTARFGGATLLVVRPGRPRPVPAGPGATASLLPVGGPVSGVTTAGLRWPLVEATLDPGTTWGVSNEVEDAAASVSIGAGTLLVVLPGELATQRGRRTTPV